jgi:hypothetical protein
MAVKAMTVTLTDDNWADHFSFDYPDSLVKGMAIGEGGVDRDGPEVARLLAWVEQEDGRSADTRYTMSRHDAAVLLELAAGWWPRG